ncbi:MAG: hypothetical protein FWF09_06545 [Bacteroidales bacterium]|nr:hypothetical protein [Bacteroidales bacterium]
MARIFILLIIRQMLNLNTFIICENPRHLCHLCSFKTASNNPFSIIHRCGFFQQLNGLVFSDLRNIVNKTVSISVNIIV